MAYTQKFQALADAAQSRVDGVRPEEVEALLRAGAVALDIRAGNDGLGPFRAGAQSAGHHEQVSK